VLRRLGLRVERGARHFAGAVCVFLGGCGQDLTPHHKGSSPTETFREESVSPQYSEHLLCTLRNETNQWQHMYRLSFDDLVGEFVGGQGGRISTLQSTAMQVSPSRVAMAFEAESSSLQDDLELRPFRVHLHRQTLVYQWFWVQADKAFIPAAPQLSGKCVLLDAESF
jgi:hypothetical protein